MKSVNSENRPFMQRNFTMRFGSENKRISKIVGFLTSACLTIFGCIVMGFSTITIEKASQSLRWKPIEGTVVKSHWHTPSEGPDYFTVEYNYKCLDRVYLGDKICFGLEAFGVEKLGQINEGQTIMVFVNPQNAVESVLVPGIDGGAKVFFSIGAGLTILGLYVSYVSLKL